MRQQTLGFSECDDSGLSFVWTLEAMPEEMSQKILALVRPKAFELKQLFNVDLISW